MSTIEFVARPSITKYLTITNNISERPKYSLLNFGNKEEYFVRYNPAVIPPVTYEKLIDMRSQIGDFLEILKKKMYLENEEEILNFLLNQSLDIDDIIAPFLFINKITNNDFFEKSKIFVEKYNDPENEDQFISIRLRQEAYPEDFIDKVWALREGFSKQFQDNDWILITTDFKIVVE
jgi:hypothetical protein